MPTLEVEKQVATKKESSKRDKMHWKDNFVYICTILFFCSKVPAFLNVTDIAGLVKGASEGQGLGNAFLSHIKACDAMFHLCRKYSLLKVLFNRTTRKWRNNERLRWYQILLLKTAAPPSGIWHRCYFTFQFFQDCWPFEGRKVGLNLLWEAVKRCLKLRKTKEVLKIWFFFWTEFSAGISSDRFKIRAKKYKLYRAIIKLVMLLFLLVCQAVSDLLTDWCCEKSGTFPKSFGAVQTNYRFVTICILQHH